MKNKLNRNGFTLVELLAVIVILAVLALVAMPNVTKLMNDSRKNAFITEVENFVTYAQTSYTNSQISGTKTPSKDESLITGQQFSVGSTTSTYDYYCVSYSQLVTNGFIQKSNGQNYNGIFEVFMPTSGAASTTIIYMTNGNYYLNGLSINKLANNSYEEGSTEFTFINSSSGSLTHPECYTSTTQTIGNKTLAAHASEALGKA